MREPMSQREREARQKAQWYAGAAVRHPHGLSGHETLFPRELTSDCRDCRDWRFSEWGNLAGMVE